MGRLKKKLVEYVEATENEQKNRIRLNEKAMDQFRSPERIEKGETTGDSEIEELEKLRTAESLGTDDNSDIQNETGNCQALKQDGLTEKKDSIKNAASKRKIIQASSKKNQKMKLQGNSKEPKDEVIYNESSVVSDEILSNDHEDAPKRGRKTVTKKTKRKTAKGGGKIRGQSLKNEDNSVEEAKQPEEYEVEDIVDHKIERGVNFYLIRWKGYTKDDDTWEAEDILTCPDMVEEYKKKMLGDITKVSKGKGTSVNKMGRKPTTTKTTSNHDPDKEWEVEKIIDYAIEKAGRVFRIRWKGFGPKNDTWEPENNLYCDDLIEKFMKRMESQKNITFKELRETPKKTKRLLNETAPRTTYHNPGERKSKRAGSKKRVYYGDSD